MSLRTLGALGVGLVLAVVVIAAAAGGLVSLVAAGSTLASSTIVPSPQALSDIPAAYLQTFEAAAATCPGLPWSVLAGIGRAESDFGADTQTSSAGAVGPMQFLPTTFAAYDTPVPPGGATPPSPLDPTDAIYAAARDLCANGAKDGADIPGAIYAYNHSQAYVAEVLSYAAAYAAPAPAATAPSPAAAEAVSYALAQIGTPYRWGGETPGVGFDCSGLTQAAYAAAGITLPRVAQDQYDVGPHVPPGAPLQPGDLVFFGASPTDVSHVGIVLNPSGEMIDAPHTGADVRVEQFPTTIGAVWGVGDVYIGATRPAG
jgi:cell wall-associated NlpC family hydrolase